LLKIKMFLFGEFQLVFVKFLLPLAVLLLGRTLGEGSASAAGMTQDFNNGVLTRYKNSG